jgi:cyclopropane-fatty-acyl-phospholipid synthase
MAERYRRSRIVAISNSAPQREFILARAAARGLTNVELLTLDVSTLSFDADAPRFDRVVSVEMFEHLRNWSEMFRRIASWLREDGRFFMHVFTHREQSYVFEDIGPSDFMARHFFTGGMMPSDRLALEIQGDLIVDQHWRLDGTHYARTARAWLNAMDENERAIREVFAATYGSDARRFWNYWRAFYMACEELWSFNSGEEWLVSHYLMRRP